MNVQIEYPEITFWNKKAKKIDFVNPEDFRKEKLLKILGLNKSELQNSFGIAERDEIVKRQRLIRFFIENPNLMKFFLCYDFGATDLPTEGQYFLDYFNPKKKHNPFWRLVNGFIKNISMRQKAPQEVLSLVNFLQETKTDLEAEERKMVDGIAKEVQKATYLEGTIDFGQDGGYLVVKGRNLRDSEVYGYKRYSYGLSGRWKKREVPNWAFEWSSIISWFFEAYFKIHNRISSRLFYSPLIIDRIPESILSAVSGFIQSKISGFPQFRYSDDVVVKMYFRYSKDGLQIRLLNVLTTRAEDRNYISPIGFIRDDFPGYGWRELRRIRERNMVFTRQADKIRHKLYSYKLVNLIEEEIPGICDKLINIDSKRVDLKFKWYAVSALYRDPAFRESYERIKKYRDYFRSNMDTLRSVASVAKTLMKRSKEWSKPLCFPEILEDAQHLVSFKVLEPIHLISETKPGSEEVLTSADLVSIASLCPLNGQVVGFTGQNAGGKSATKEAIVNAIFLAQSGLPVFGRDFSLNVKRQVGMVFLERGSGSTCELLLRKTKAMLESVNGTGQNGIVLVLDEVGTGTQEIDGFSYGKKLLKKLADSHYSVLFSTQITDLAKYARDELNAECFTFDLQHQIKPGIGRGGIEKLMNEIGIDRLLN